MVTKTKRQISAEAAIIVPRCIAFLSMKPQFTGSIAVITANPIQSWSDTSVGSFRKRANVNKSTEASAIVIQFKVIHQQSLYFSLKVS